MQKIVKSPSKHYSPLRYPGGKAGLSDFLASVIKSNKINDCVYVEPYAGGAGAALTMLFLEKVDSIVINDLDKSIYSFWKSILTHSDAFIERIERTRVNMKEWHIQREIYRSKNPNQLDLGFATFFMNRTNRSGIIEGGPIGGALQKGTWKVDARFNKSDLIQRIINIASYKSRIKVSNKDGIELLKDIYKNKNQFIYLDPPYYIKGSSLYLNHYVQENHKNLAAFLNKNNNFYWLLTYDNVEEIKKLYCKRRNYDFSFHYHIDLPKLGNELLVVSDKVSFK
jgi:DNA adenine methylase